MPPSGPSATDGTVAPVLFGSVRNELAGISASDAIVDLIQSVMSQVPVYQSKFVPVSSPLKTPTSVPSLKKIPDPESPASVCPGDTSGPEAKFVQRPAGQCWLVQPDEPGACSTFLLIVPVPLRSLAP